MVQSIKTTIHFWKNACKSVFVSSAVHLKEACIDVSLAQYPSKMAGLFTYKSSQDESVILLPSAQNQHSIYALCLNYHAVQAAEHWCNEDVTLLTSNKQKKYTEKYHIQHNDFERKCLVLENPYSDLCVNFKMTLGFFKAERNQAGKMIKYQ